MYTYDSRLLESMIMTPEMLMIMGGILCACLLAEIMTPMAVRRYEVNLENIRALEKQERLREMILMKEVQSELESELASAEVDAMRKST